MIRPAAASLTARPLRPTLTASAPVASRPALQSLAARSALHTDRFDRGPARSRDAQPSGLVRSDNRLPSPFPSASERLNKLSPRQKLDLLRNHPPERQNYPPTLGGANQYREAKANYERRIEQLEAHVKYDKLKAQGGPQREDYPSTLKGSLAYEKARDTYIKRLQELAIAAGLFHT